MLMKRPPLELGNDAKRIRTSPEDIKVQVGELQAEYYFEQRFVGWVVGKGGSAAKNVEDTFQVRLSVDQSTKDQGYSRLSIVGLAANVQAAAENINLSMAKAASTPTSTPSGPFLLDRPPAPTTDDWYEAVPFDQKYVGWLIGRGGGVIREIEQQTGCRIGINQKMCDSGVVKAEIRGDSTQRAFAVQLLQESLQKVGGQLLSGNEVVLGGAASRGFASGLSSHTNGKSSGDGDSLANAASILSELSKLSPSALAVLEGLGGIKGLGDLMAGLQVLMPLLDLGKALNNLNLGQGEMGLLSLLGNLGGNGGGNNTDLLGVLKEALPGLGGRSSGHSAVIEDAQPPAVSLGTSDDIVLEQKWVGWVLGRGGGVLKEIEDLTATKISIDQSTKDLGYSTVKVQGSPAQYIQVKAKLQELLEKAGGGLLSNKSTRSPAVSSDGGWMSNGVTGVSSWQQGPSAPAAAPVAGSLQPLAQSAAEAAQPVKTQLHLEQQWVGWVLGRGGAVVREIEQASGANISIDQSTKLSGHSIVHITGTPSQIVHVQELIQDKLKLINGTGAGLSDPLSPQERPIEAPPLQNMPRRTLELQIEQKWIGWIVGKGGQTVKDLQASTGAQIAIDQSTKEMGYSVLKVVGSEEAVSAVHEKIQASLVAASSRDGSSVVSPGGLCGDGEPDMQVEQKYIGWIVGRGGMVLKELEDKSGARISIDQSTKHQGFSTVHITGDYAQCHVARQLLNEKIVQALPEGGGV